MKNVYFEPWVGKRYNSGYCGKRVLILGESHYRWPKAQPDELGRWLTRQCVEEQIGERKPKTFKGGSTPFWTNIVVAFTKKRNPSLEDKKEFWHSVAFYNYIQEIVGEKKARKRSPSPSTEMWANARDPFSEVLAKLRPQYIVVLGVGLWWKLPNCGEERKIARVPCGEGKTGFYSCGKGKALAFQVEHPSSGSFSSLKWHAPLMRALKLAPRK